MPVTQRARELRDRLAMTMLGLFLAALAGVIPVLAPAAAPPVLNPDRVVVSEVIIQGSHQAPIENIKKQLKTRVGKEFNPDQLQEDVRGLFATKQFGNVWADKQDDGPHRVKVFLYLRDLPSMVQKITYKGNINLSDSELDEITNLRKGMPMNPIANKIACFAIVRRYGEDGRPFASCNLLKGSKARDTEIIFNIHEGPRVHVRDIQFTGNTFVSCAELKKHINSSHIFFDPPTPGAYSTWFPALGEDDVEDLVKYYHLVGYPDVKVSLELVWSGDGREVTPIFHIQEGAPSPNVSENAPNVNGDPPHDIGLKSLLFGMLEAFETMLGHRP